MTEKKEILLEVKTQMATSIKEIADLNHKVADLRAEEKKLELQMQGLAKSGKQNSDEFRLLEQQLAANKEQQKAYRKEINEVSRSVQNAIIAEGKYADTLKGKAAQLSVEKDKLRQIKISNGELSQEYKAQQKVVADLNAEVMELERNYGTHTRNVGNYESAWGGMLNRLKLGWAALIALLGKGIKEFGEDFVKMTQKTGDMFTIEVAGWKDAYAAFIVSLQRGDGWDELINNIKSAYRAGKQFADMLDELMERENSLRLEEASVSAENEQLLIDMRDRTKTDEERIAAGQKYLDNVKKLAETRQSIANQERDANKGRLQELTKMTDAELEFYVKEYNANRKVITQALEYNKALKEQEDIIKSAQRERAIQQGRQIGAAGGQIGTAGGGSIETQAEKNARERIAQIQAEASDGLKEVAAIAAKYSMTSDELVTAFVESEIKAQTVASNMLRETARAQTQMHTLQAEIARDNAQAAETEAQEQEKAAEMERKAQEDALKAQEKAVAAYVATVTKIYDDLDNARLTDTERQVKAVKVQYQEQMRTLAEQVRAGMMSWEEYMYYRVALSQKASAEIAAINKAAQEKEAQEQEKAIADEARKRRELLQIDLKVAWDNAEEQFRIKREYLLKELALSELSAERRAELEQQLSELMKEHTDSRIQMVMDYAGQLEQAFGAVNDIAKNMSQSRIQDAEAENAQEKAALEKRLKAGLISQKQYDEKVEKMDAELAAEKAQETRKQAERDKALALFQAAINTASAIVKVWTDVPTMIAPAFTAIVAGVGALQMAAIASQPLPKARKGGRVEGATHEQGGVLIETEGEERIVAANPSRAFPELLNLISYIGKNAGIPQTGFAERFMAQEKERTTGANMKEVDYDRIAELFGVKVAEVMKGFEFWLSVKEFRDAEDNIVRMEELTRQ